MPIVSTGDAHTCRLVHTGYRMMAFLWPTVARRSAALVLDNLGCKLVAALPTATYHTRQNHKRMGNEASTAHNGAIGGGGFQGVPGMAASASSAVPSATDVASLTVPQQMALLTGREVDTAYGRAVVLRCYPGRRWLCAGSTGRAEYGRW